MSAVIVELRPRILRTDASEVPAVIAGNVNLMAFSGALAQAGIMGRFDRDRGVLVIEPAQERTRCMACGGTGFDEDAACEFCGGTGRGGESADARCHNDNPEVTP